MNSKRFTALKPALGLAFGASLSAGVLAQSNLENEYPELAQLYDSFYVTHAAAMDAIAGINADPATAQAREGLRDNLEMMAGMSHMEMMSMMSVQAGEEDAHAAMGHSMNTGMGGPFGEREAEARVNLGRMIRAEYSAAEVSTAYRSSSALPTHAAMTLEYGRQFESNLWNIWADADMSISAKVTASNQAVADYASGDEMHAVSLEPKSAALYLDSPYADALQTGFPRISGLLWSNQWLQLASLEAIIVGQVDPQFANRVDVTLERYNNKLGSDTGMSMFPPPTEMPSAPAISPQLYSLVPQAAIIIDNLNMMETAIADIIAYPNLDNREDAIIEVVEQFTSDANNADDMDYLLSALRGGIFNQGGPAIGELSGSERNRSREMMDMVHTMIMSSPQ